MNSISLSDCTSLDFTKGFMGKCTTADEVKERRAAIEALGDKLATLPQTEFPVTNRFAGGVYIREIFMPAGNIVIGKIHTTQFFNVLVSGQCLIATTEGILHIRAPYTFVSEPGSQKCGLCITDVVWQTIHATDSTDVEEIVSGLTTDSYDKLETDFALDELGKQLCQ
jgi:hypothetical protein